MSTRNKIAMAITLLSLFCFVPGIFLPMLTIHMEGTLLSQVANMEVPVLNKTSSILQTVEDLWRQGLALVAVLIFLFSVAVPLLKAMLLVFAAFSSNIIRSNQCIAFVKAIGKWSMCDVFVVAIFLTYLSTSAGPTTSSHQVAVMGFRLNLDVAISMQASLESGFYYFLGYCLLSLIALQIYQDREQPKQ